jgi:hypothetical protein
MLNSGAAQGEMPVEFVVAQFKWIMLVGGLITLTMLQAAFAPRAALRGLLGEEPQGQLGLLLARNWGVLVALTGAMLIWGAFHPEARPLILLVAGASKLAFISLVLGNAAYRRKAIIPLIIDGALVVLFTIYLASML